MYESRRLLGVGALLALAAVITCTHVWGGPGRDGQERGLDAWRAGGPNAGRDQAARRLLDEAGAARRFDQRPVVLYRTEAGETLFALQLQPQLADAPARPRDWLVLLDTSASKAGGPLALAQKLTELLVQKLGPEDRLALWTANVKPANLSKGFKHAAKLTAALAELKKEYPSGAANLKQGLADAVASFPQEEGRQRVLLFLGDDTSVAGPVSADDRAELCAEMVRREVAFFCVPLGERSHIPFPDEPPVEYPSAAIIRKITRGTFDNWIDWSKDRKFRYGRLKGVGITIRAGGVGLTLTHAWKALFVDLDWNPGSNWQAEDRVCRIGQTSNTVEIVRMVSNHALDKHVQKLLQWKIAMVQNAVGRSAAPRRAGAAQGGAGAGGLQAV
jgi:hypothetical protein